MNKRLIGLAMIGGGLALIVAGICAKRLMDATWLLIPLHTLGFIGGLVPGLLLLTSQEWEPHAPTDARTDAPRAD